MKNRIWVSSALAVSLASAVVACEGDDVTEGPGDAGLEASTVDGSFADGAASDAAVEAGPVRPPWVLYSFNYSDETDLAAYSLDAGAFDGVLTYSGKIGQSTIAADGPWLLEQSNDLVAKLDPAAPLAQKASWDVHGTDGFDGGFSYADPVKVIEGPAGKAYVPRFNRNSVAVIDTTQTGDRNPATKYVDLSAYLSPTDTDGVVDMVAGAYVASQHRVYVLLANLDINDIDPQGFFTLCGTTRSELVAIDTDTDTVVSAADGGAAAAPVVLSGYNAVGLLVDSARNRLLAIHAGCNDPGAPDSGMPGALHMREVDAFDLGTGVATQALDLTAAGYPSAFAMVDATHIAFGFDFGFGGNLWDVTTSTLGAVIPNAPDLFGYDGNGHLVGSHTDFLADGGQATVLESVRVDDGGVTSFGAPPFRKRPAVVSNADFWSP